MNETWTAKLILDSRWFKLRITILAMKLHYVLALPGGIDSKSIEVQKCLNRIKKSRV